MAKARYIARVCYDDDFKAELEKFSKLIKIDAHIAELSKKNKNQRFSAAIRFLIEEYNKSKTTS